MLLRRLDGLNDTQRAHLEGLFEPHPRLRAAREALTELHGLCLADDEAGALAALDRFCDLYAHGDLPEFHRIGNTSSPPCLRSSPGTPPITPPTGVSRAPTTTSKS